MSLRIIFLGEEICWIFIKNVRDSSVGIGASYGLDDREGQISSSSRVEEFSLLHVIEIGSWAQPVSYPQDNRSSLPVVKRVGREGDHSLSTSAEVTTPPHVYKA
jgi:hypothetical protein